MSTQLIDQLTQRQEARTAKNQGIYRSFIARLAKGGTLKDAELDQLHEIAIELGFKPEAVAADVETFKKYLANLAIERELEQRHQAYRPTHRAYIEFVETRAEYNKKFDDETQRLADIKGQHEAKWREAVQAAKENGDLRQFRPDLFAAA